jgi:hypothetical protein
MLRLLPPLAASAQLMIRYTFNKIYDTDLSGNGNHAVKDAPGGFYMINTKTGLYLSRARLLGSKQLQSFPVASTAPATVFVRFRKQLAREASSL